MKYAKGCPAREGLTSSVNMELRVRMLSLWSRLRAESAASWTVSRAANTDDTTSDAKRATFIINVSVIRKANMQRGGVMRAIEERHLDVVNALKRAKKTKP